MKKKLIVLQHGNKDCGSASLLSIIRYYGGNISLAKLEELTYTTKNGTNFLNIKNAAFKIGLYATGYKLNNLSKIYEINTPFICQLKINNSTHFVVVYNCKNNKLLIMDPAKGKVIINFNEFDKLWTHYIMVFDPYKKLDNYTYKKYLNKIIIEIIKNNKSMILNVLILSLLFSILSCIITYYFQIILNNIIDTNYFNLILITLIFIIITIYKNIICYFRNELIIYLNQKIDLSLMLNTFNKLLLLPYNYYKNKTTGEIVSRINDIALVKNTISKMITTVFLDSFIFVFGGIILFFINSKLFLFLIIISLVYIFIMLFYNKIIRSMIDKNQKNNARVNSFLTQTINGYETIKGINLEDIMSNKFEGMYLDILKDNLYFEKINNSLIFVKELLSNLTNIFIIFIGTKLIISNDLSLGNLITFNFLSSYYINPIKEIIDIYNDYFYMKNSLKRANDLFEVNLIDNSKNNVKIFPNIKVSNLNFKYSNKLILRNVSFEIKDGERVLLLGNSGCGKSTLLKLLFKYYIVDRNSIFIDNIDINDYKVMDIRDNISYISQNEILFNDTIRNNITLDKNIDEKKFFDICRITYVDDIVKDEILGYDKLLEENAINISGGQRQRIILARTLLKDSKIILIDEGLNEIDINMERKILKNIFDVYSNKTFIIVSHRINNMDLFNKVIRIDNNTNVIVRKDNYE